MYPECRHVRPGGSTCHAPALKGSYWCYFHAHLHDRQTVRHAHRLGNGHFTPQPEAGTDPRATAHEGAGAKAGAPGASLATRENTTLDLPPIEDAASIQLALIDVLQALAANQLDPRRAGLLLYGLQVASANMKHTASHSAVRTVTHADDGTPLAPQNYGYDIEDFEELQQEEENRKRSSS